MQSIQHYADQVLSAIGGRDNIKALEHCLTRLRINVKDESLVNQALIQHIDDTKGYFYQSNQHQIIFGTGLVDKVFHAINAEEDLKQA